MNMNKLNLIPLSLAGLTILTGLILSSTTTSATDDSVVDEINITVPVSCTLTGTGMNTHNAEILNGQYNSSIGETTLKAFCNDNEGFAIYAIGYTDNEEGKNVLTNSTLGSTYDITTGTAITGNDSKWAMKLTKLTSPTPTYPVIIAGSTEDSLKEQGDLDYSTFQEIPNNYAKVAYRAAATDTGTNAEGSTLKTTYQAYISKTQPAGTYTGQVKYTLIHPYDHAAPIANPATLDTGRTVNAKLKSLAATVVNQSETIINPSFKPYQDKNINNAYDYNIKSINVHLKTPVPTDFTPSEKNTISAPTSKKPIYIIFDNTDNVGIMHFYTEGEQIFLPVDSSYLFYLFYNLADLSAVSNWNSSNVMDMSYMFYDTGEHASSLLLDLSSWNTSSVTDMSYMFYETGYRKVSSFTLDLSSWNTSSVTNMLSMFDSAGGSATTWSIGDLSSWNTSNVTNMRSMFDSAGESATTWSIGDISSWNTSNVTDMREMFYDAGYSAETFTLNLSSWKTSNVTDIGYMFAYAGYSAETFTLNLSSWNTSSVIFMDDMFYSAGSSATTFTLDLSSWNPSNAVYMNEVFSYAGYSAETFTLNLSSWNTASAIDMELLFYSAGYSAETFTLDLSSWNTASVTEMNMMFDDAGYSASTWSVTIPQTNGGGISNTINSLYGKTTSVYGASPSGKSFTLAQP